MGDCNGDILPTLQLHDAQIAHVGYLHEGIRRQKATGRNLPLLMRDQEVFPDRVLGKVLLLRECVTQAAWKQEANGGERTPEIATLWSKAIALFEENFLDPENRFHSIARPFYEQAVSRVRGAIEVETALGGSVQGLKGRRAEPMRFWARVPAHIKPMLDHYQRQALKVYDRTEIDVEPVETREAVSA